MWIVDFLQYNTITGTGYVARQSAISNLKFEYRCNVMLLCETIHIQNLNLKTSLF